MSDTPANPAAAEPEIHPTISKLTDFSDRISPMMVKELRQGMRTRAFTGTFLILQMILGFSMLIALMSDAGDTGKLISSIVFFLFSIVAIILQPLRGVSAVAAEFKDDTLEIMSLTRLTSLRIVLGKWASLVSQTALMLSATVPYLVMRYFFGGMELFAELALLFTIFFLSMCLTGVTVGLSCTRSVLIRGLVPLILIPGGLMMISGLLVGNEMRGLYRMFNFQDEELVFGLLTFLVMGAYIGYYFLDMGVSRIAVVAENHAVRKRGVSLVLLVVILTILFFNPPFSVISFVIMLVFSVAVGIDVCSERAVSVPSVVEPYVRRGRLGKLFGRLFYPGWHSGFYLVTILFFATLLVGQFTFSENAGRTGSYETGLIVEIAFTIVGVFYTLLAPLLITRIFKDKIKDVFTGYVGVLVVCAIFTSMVGIFSEMSRSGEEAILYVSSWIPGVWMLMLSHHSTEGSGLVLHIAYLAVVWLFLFVMANQEFRRTAELEEIAETQNSGEEE